MLIDAASVHLAAATLKPDFSAEVTARADHLNAEFRAEIGVGLDGREAADGLQRYLETVESELARLAATHSRGYWLFMTRRLPPHPFGSATDWTHRLYRRVVTLSALKYGQPEILDEEFMMVDTKLGQERLPVDLSHEALVDVFSFEYLAFEYVTATQAYRRVGKGARLVATADDFIAEADDELEQLIQDVDRRVEHYGDLTGMYGAAADRSFPMDLDSEDESPIAILTAIPIPTGFRPVSRCLAAV